MTEPPRTLTQREYWNSKVGEEWANHADGLDRMLQPMTQPALDLLNLQLGEHVLDIGCGAGATTLTIAQRVGESGHVVGVDLSQQLLALGRKRAAERGARIDFLEADAGVVPLQGAPFDAAFSRFGVMFFADTVAAFANLRQNIKPGGRLVFVCWRTFEENIWSSAPLAALAPILKAPVPAPDSNAPGPFALADAAKIQSALASSGWRDAVIEPWDGAVLVAGGGGVSDAADFLLKIGPCARAIHDQQLDTAQAKGLLAEALAKHETASGVALPAACWIVRAVA